MENTIFIGTRKYYINIAVTILLMFVIGMIPALDGVTPMGMAVLGIFIGAIYGWLTIGIAPTCIIGFTALIICGYSTFNEMIAYGMSKTTVILILLMFPFVGMLNKSGIVRWFAIKCFHLKIAQKRPYMFFFIIYIVEGFVFTITGAMPLIFLFWQLFSQLFALNGMDPKSKTCRFLIVNSVFAAAAPAAMYPYNFATQAAMGIYSNATGLPAPNVGGWFVISLIIFIVSLLLVLIYGKCIVGIKLSGLRVDDIEESPDLTFYQETVGIVFIVFIAILVLISVLPADWFFTALFTKIGAAGLAMIMVIIVVLMKFKEGSSLQEYCNVGALWDILFMVLFVLVLSGAFASDSTGINSWLITSISPLFSEMSSFVFLAVIAVLATALTNVLNNFIVITFMIPLSCTIAVGMGINPVIPFTLIAIGSNCGLMFPSSSTWGAILSGNTEMVSTKDCMIYGLANTIITIGALIVVGIPLAGFIF